MPGIATQADVEAAEAGGLPADLPDSTYDMLHRAALAHPQAPALSFFLRAADQARPERWSYGQLFAEITRAANLFHALGAGKDSVIAYVLPNLPETHFTIWGGQATGIVAAINPLLEAEAIAELLRAAGAEILVTLAPFPGVDLWPRLRPALARVPGLRHVLLVNLADRVRGLRRGPARLLQWRERRRAGAAPGPWRVHDFGRALRAQPGERLLSGRRIAADDYSSYFCTGGTTGLPKLAMRRHRNEVANAWSAAQFLGDSIGPGKNAFCGLPLFHVNAVLVTGLLPFSKGAHVVLGTPQGYRGEGVIEDFWSIVARHRIHFFSGVPTLYGALLQVPRGGRRIDSLEYALCGAAPMPPELFRRFQDETGVKILEGYGLTEGTCVSCVNPPRGERRIGSVGLRIPGQAAKVVLLDAAGRYLRDAADGEAGVLAISGPNVFAGYLREEQNRGLWLDLGDGRRWLHTGDLARRDADGYFWLTGRTKELIIRGGHNIDPAAIEQPLHAHPAVQLAAAVGRPDAHAGELPVAYVQLKPGDSIGEEALLAHLAARIGERAALPKAILIVEQIPLTAVGKIYKPELKRQQAEYALAQALAGAGVRTQALRVELGDGRGMQAEIELQRADDAAAARSVLDRFPLACRLHAPAIALPTDAPTP